MRELAKTAIMVFVVSFVPITIWNAGQLCDPKSGCHGSFYFLLMIVSMCSAITTISVFAAQYVSVVYWKKTRSKRKTISLLGCCAALGIASNDFISFVDIVGELPPAIIIWAAVSFFFGVIFLEKVP
ncbi:MAG: hypothetical protein RBT16_15355 [Desulfococcus multivorans]|jgi:hypothetical protein|nr:hypothetical protein [Desulfococcus multivorans]